MVLTCQRCGDEFTRKPTPGVVPKYCPVCANELAKAARKAYKDEMKANGWCVDCGRAARPGRVRCEECAARQRAYMKEWNIGERRRKKKDAD